MGFMKNAGSVPPGRKDPDEGSGHADRDSIAVSDRLQISEDQNRGSAPGNCLPRRDEDGLS
jgi:hypothetical protein